MLLRVFCWQSGGYWLGMTRYCGHEKKWIADNLKSLKQKTGPFLATAHRARAMMDISRLTYVEGIPNDDTVYLTTDPQKRKYTKRKKYRFEKYNKSNNSKKSIKVMVDGVVFNSIKDAEHVVGFGGDTLGSALRSGKTEALGHTIAYVNNDIKQSTQPKVETDNTEYLYKVESGYLKIYRKELCKEYKISTF